MWRLYVRAARHKRLVKRTATVAAQLSCRPQQLGARMVVARLRTRDADVLYYVTIYQSDDPTKIDTYARRGVPSSSIAIDR